VNASTLVIRVRVVLELGLGLGTGLGLKSGLGLLAARMRCGAKTEKTRIFCTSLSHTPITQHLEIVLCRVQLVRCYVSREPAR